MPDTFQTIHGKLFLTGNLTIAESESLKSSLLNYLSEAACSSGTQLHVDLSGVSRCDVAALQILVAGAKYANSMSRRLVFCDLSADVSACASKLGLSLADELSLG